MASPGELVKGVAKVFGAPEASVTLHDRNLADAGLRAKGGRGRSAAKMTATDAANLLIAVAGSSMIKDAVQVVKDYSSLPVERGDVVVDKSAPPSMEPSKTRWALPGFPLPALQNLSDTHTFGDAVTALIVAAEDGSLQRVIRNLPAVKVGNHQIPNQWRIEVVLWGPYPQAAIRIYSRDFQENHHYSKIPSEVDGILAWAKEMDASIDHGDLLQIREFSGRTILAIGELLSS